MTLANAPKLSLFEDLKFFMLFEYPSQISKSIASSISCTQNVILHSLNQIHKQIHADDCRWAFFSNFRINRLMCRKVIQLDTNPWRDPWAFHSNRQANQTLRHQSPIMMMTRLTHANLLKNNEIDLKLSRNLTYIQWQIHEHPFQFSNLRSNRHGHGAIHSSRISLE